MTSLPSQDSGRGEWPTTVREQAEMVAKFRTPPGMQWQSLADDIETLLTARSWKPIESAPKDGSGVLLYGSCSISTTNMIIAGYADGKWFRSRRFDGEPGSPICECSGPPTHWQPLPAPPVSA